MAAALPRDVAVLTDLGIAYDLLGQHELAQKMYRQALDIAPDLVSARNNLGLSLALSAQPERALEVLRPLDATRAQSARMRANLQAVLSGGGVGLAPGSITGAAPPGPPVQPAVPNAGS
jgi:Flp pilus assembly protein TadD